MVKTCFVPSCKQNSSFGDHLLFFNVPENHTKRKIWFSTIGIENSPRGKAYYCCGNHFDFPDDAENWMKYELMKGTVLRLKGNVIPHKNLHPAIPFVENVSQHLQAIPGPSNKRHKEPHNLPPPKQLKIVFPQVVSGSPGTSTNSDIGSSLIFLSTSVTESTTDEEIQNFDNNLLLHRREETTLTIIENNSRFYLGLPENIYKLVDIITQHINILHRDVLISLKKIRLDDVYLRLGLDFNLSTSAIQKIFVKSVPKIAGILKNFIFFPTKKQIKKLLPISFRYRYSHVHYIIDCFEIELQKPSNPVHQSHTWSEYKKCNTAKYLISGTPSGFINFISSGFGGRISDTNIVVAGKFIDNIENCNIMADRGFKHIVPLLSRKKCNLIRPPSVGDHPLSPTEIREAKRIAALRIHIERLIGRIREFKMVDIHACVNLNLLNLLDDIVVIVCALINVQGPLIK